jgi:NADH:flavin oxidoreductases, Old Yellow Enzyme family
MMVSVKESRLSLLFVPQSDGMEIKMDRGNYTIFSPGKIGNLTLKNRLIRSATCEYKMSEDGFATKIVLDIYHKLAEGGVGMIITGLTAVTKKGKGASGQACIYDDSFISELSKIAEAVHTVNNGSLIFAQLCHAGGQLTEENTNVDCVGPTAMLSLLLQKKIRELSVGEIEYIIKEFSDAIERIKKAGFDGVQLHAAHGYLLSSFLSPYTNQRTDRFGGSDKNRVCIIREIILSARNKVGNFPIIIKINCNDHITGGITKENFPDMLREIADTGVDAIEVSGGMWDCLVRTEEELGFIPVPLPEARTHIDSLEKQSYYYSDIKNLDVSVPLILVGGNRNIESMETIIKDGHVNFLSLSRPLISEPGLPKRWFNGNGSDTAHCVSCNACLFFKDEFSCALKRLNINKDVFEAAFAKGWRTQFK